jgi:hypothetical protein
VRTDTAWLWATTLAAAAIIMLAAGEILADKLTPVDRAIMGAIKEATQAIL